MNTALNTELASNKKEERDNARSLGVRFKNERKSE